MNEIPYDYAEFQRRARLSVQRRRGQRRALAATAACAMLVVVGAAWLSRGPGERAGADGLLAVSQVAASADSAPARASSQDRLRVASRPLLTDLPAEPAVVQLASGLAASRLEDRIAVLDDALNEAQFGGDTLASIHSLRSERMQLLDSLVRVRYAERMAAAVR